MSFDIKLFEALLCNPDPYHTGGKRKTVFFESVDSTNLALERDLKNGTAHPGDVYIAGFQTAGKGRGDKSFSSPAGGLYFSFAVPYDPSFPFTVCAGFSVCRALRAFGYGTSVKWVNDILLNGRKLCGILARNVPSSASAVIGAGINYTADALPESLREIAAGLSDEPGAAPPTREELCSSVINEFEMNSGKDTAEIINGYKSFLSFLGKEITVLNSGKRLTAADVDGLGRLVCESSAGDTVILDSGEISILL